MKEKKMIVAFALVALSATAADVVLTGETEYAVAKGKTTSVAERITGEGAILKTGDGDLALSGSGNDFSGGVKISGGTVTASSANALGTGKVTVSDASAGVNFKVAPASSGEYITFDNALEFTGDESVGYGSGENGDGKKNVVFFENTRLTGDMIGTRSFRLRHNPKNTGSPTNGGPSTIFEGKLDAGENDIYLNVYGTMTVNGPITANLLSGGEAWSGGGTLALYNPENSIRTLAVCHNIVKCGANNVLGGSVVTWRLTGTSPTTGLSLVNMNGLDQTVAGLSQHIFSNKSWNEAFVNSAVGSGWNKNTYTYCVMSSTPATLTITGDGMDLTTYAPLMGAASLVVDAKENKTFKQTFTRHNSDFSGTTEVRAGILEIDGLARFSKTTSVSVSSGAKFLCRSTNSNPALESVKILSVEGVFDASEASVNPFSTLDSISFGAESEVYLPENVILFVQSMQVAGKSVEGRLFDPSNLPNLKSGRILVVGGDMKTSAWTGATSGALTDSGNWSAGFIDGALKAVFAESGTSATVDADATLYEIIFRAAEDKDGFSLVRSDPAHPLTVGLRISALTNDLAATPHTYMIDNPLKVFDILTFHADTNQTLVVRNALHESVDEIGLHKIYVDGRGAAACVSGSVVFDGTNYFGGELTMSTSVVRVSGKLANPDDTYTGDPGEDGDGSSINVWLGKGGAQAGGKNSNYGLILSNAVVGKSMFVQNQIGKRTITTEPGTTNVFSGYLRYNDNGDPSHQGVEVSVGSELTLAGGLHGSHSFRKYGSGTLRIKDIPVDCQKSAGFNPVASGRVIFEVPNNTFKYLVLGYGTLNSSMVVETTVDNVLTNGLVQVGGDGGAADNCRTLTSGTYTLDVHSTTQRCQKIAVLKQGTLTGEYPAMVEISEGWLDATDTKAADPDGYRYLGNVTGGVGLHQCGPGLLTVTNAVSSCGDLIVSDGVVEFTGAGSWLNGTNVTVTGSGTLKLAQGTHFRSRTTALHLGADGDSWKIDIPAGVSHSVAALCDSEGNKLSAGVYGNANSGAANTRYASHFPNNGTLNVRRSGMAVSIR